MNKNPLYEMHAIFHGHVQGVGFRVTTLRYAMELGLYGTVRNRSDGSVEVYAQGEKPGLEMLTTVLQDKFQIDQLDVNFYSPTTLFTQFSIID
ncbi:MAG: acylphosphatase [Parachlamydiaceae bacterium]